MVYRFKPVSMVKEGIGEKNDGANSIDIDNKNIRANSESVHG